MCELEIRKAALIAYLSCPWTNGYTRVSVDSITNRPLNFEALVEIAQARAGDDISLFTSNVALNATPLFPKKVGKVFLEALDELNYQEAATHAEGQIRFAELDGIKPTFTRIRKCSKALTSAINKGKPFDWEANKDLFRYVQNYHIRCRGPIPYISSLRFKFFWLGCVNGGLPKKYSQYKYTLIKILPFHSKEIENLFEKALLEYIREETVQNLFLLRPVTRTTPRVLPLIGRTPFLMNKVQLPEVKVGESPVTRAVLYMASYIESVVSSIRSAQSEGAHGIGAVYVYVPYSILFENVELFNSDIKYRFKEGLQPEAFFEKVLEHFSGSPIMRKTAFCCPYAARKIFSNTEHPFYKAVHTAYNKSNELPVAMFMERYLSKAFRLIVPYKF